MKKITESELKNLAGRLRKQIYEAPIDPDLVQIEPSKPENAFNSKENIIPGIPYTMGDLVFDLGITGASLTIGVFGGPPGEAAAIAVNATRIQRMVSLLRKAWSMLGVSVQGQEAVDAIRTTVKACANNIQWTVVFSTLVSSIKETYKKVVSEDQLAKLSLLEAKIKLQEANPLTIGGEVLDTVRQVTKKAKPDVEVLPKIKSKRSPRPKTTATNVNQLAPELKAEITAAMQAGQLTPEQIQNVIRPMMDNLLMTQGQQLRTEFAQIMMQNPAIAQWSKANPSLSQQVLAGLAEKDSQTILEKVYIGSMTAPKIIWAMFKAYAVVAFSIPAALGIYWLSKLGFSLTDVLKWASKNGDKAIQDLIKPETPTPTVTQVPEGVPEGAKYEKQNGDLPYKPGTEALSGSTKVYWHVNPTKTYGWWDDEPPAAVQENKSITVTDQMAYLKNILTEKPVTTPVNIKPEPVKVETPPVKVEPPTKVETPPVKVETPPVKVETPPVKVETPPVKVEPTPAGTLLYDAPAGVKDGNYTVKGQKVTVKLGKVYTR